MANNNKDKILIEASRLISRKGYFGAGLNEILTACQIPKGSFYYYFPKGKNQMTSEVIYYAFETMKEGIQKNIFKDDNNALSVFMRMIDRLSNGLKEEDHYFQSLIITFIGIEAPYISKDVREAALDVYNKWEYLYKEKLEECGYEETQAAALAPVLCSLIHGTLIGCWIKQSIKDFDNLKEMLPLLLTK